MAESKQHVTPRDEMTPLQFDDFAAQLRLSILEEAPLWEVPQGALDHVGSGRTVQHGPWRPSDCAEVLRAWLDGGLVELYRSPISGTPEDIDLSQARRLLSDTDQWTVDNIADVRLVATERGRARDFGDWLSVLADQVGE